MGFVNTVLLLVYFNFVLGANSFQLTEV